MALKLMVFIDGYWFYNSRQTLFNLSGEESFEIDYKRIPALIQDSLCDELDFDVDLIRTFYHGTLPINKVGYNPTKQRVFYESLSAQCGFETDIMEIDCRVEGNLTDDCSAHVALAANAVRYASMPHACDVISIVGGHIGYKALAKQLRSFGKRVMLVTMHNHGEELVTTSPSLVSSPALFDFPHLFLDDHIADLRLVRKEQKRACKTCGAEESTTWAGSDFFCATCRTEHHVQVRVCDTCGCEEETTWEKNYFYCTKCRRQHRETK